MNSDSPQNTAILNQLILLVLSLILICLVLLVVRAYTRPAETAAAPVETPAVAEEPPPIVSYAPPVRAMPVPAPGRGKTSPPVPPTRTPRPPVEVAAAPTPEAPAVPWIAYPPISGASVPRISQGGVEGGSVPSGGVRQQIMGFVTLAGTPPPEFAFSLSPACGRLNPGPKTTRHYIVGPDGELANVFVYVSKGVNKKWAPPVSESGVSAGVLLDQVKCFFEPYMLGLQTGQSLEVRNSDPELHNVHVTSRVNKEGNFAQLRGQRSILTFDQPEVFVRVKCDVHPWMFAHLGVVEHPFHAVTDTNGFYRLPKGLRAGRYTLTATHLKAGTLSKEIDFRPGEPNPLHFQFTVPTTAQAR